MHMRMHTADGYQYDSRYGSHKEKHHHLRHANRYKVHPEGSKHVHSELLAGEVKPVDQEGKDRGSKDTDSPHTTNRAKEETEATICWSKGAAVTVASRRGEIRNMSSLHVFMYM